MFQVLLLALFVARASAGCAQDILQVRNQFQVAENFFGLDLTLWHRLGSTLVGTVTGTAQLTPGTSATISDTQSLTSTSWNKAPTRAELLLDRENDGSGDYQTLTGKVAISGGATNVPDKCIITVGGGPTTSNGFCLTAQGKIRFPLDFQSDCDGAAGTNGDFEILIWRYLDNGEDGDRDILTSIYARYNGFVCTGKFGNPQGDGDKLKIQTKFELNNDIWTVGDGFAINSAPTGQTLTVTSLVGTRARYPRATFLDQHSPVVADSTGATTTFPTFSPVTLGIAARDDITECIYETWTTKDVPVIPGSGTGNFVLTWTVTNFGPTPTVTPTGGEVRFTPAEFPLLQLSNFTSITVTNGAFNTANFNGLLTTGTAHTISPLAIGQSSTLTITATMGNCTRTGPTWNLGDGPKYVGGPGGDLAATSTVAVPPATTAPSGDVIVVSAANKPVEFYVRRRSKLRLIETDLRDYDSSGLPIAVGCNVPYNYELDVFNEGPSCAEDTVLNTDLSLFGTGCDGNPDPITGTTQQIRIDGFAKAAGANNNGLVLEGDGPLFPGQLNPKPPALHSIVASASTPNIQDNGRNVYVVASQSGADQYSSDDVLNDDDDDFAAAADRVDQTSDPDTGNDVELFDLTYDLRRYADLQLRLGWEDRGTALVRDDSVVAGFFRDGDDYNLRAELTVTNVQCVDVRDIRLAIDIEQPADIWFLDVDTRGERLQGVHVPLSNGGRKFSQEQGTARVQLQGNQLSYTVQLAGIDIDTQYRRTVRFVGATAGLAQVESASSVSQTVTGTLTVDAATIAKLEAGLITMSVDTNALANALTGTIPPVNGPALVKDSAFTRYVDIPTLSVGESRKIELDFQACHSANAAPGGVRISARIARAGDQRADLDGQLHLLDVTEPVDFFGDQCARVTLVRRFDDLVDDVANVLRAAEVHVTAECDEPRLISKGGRIEASDSDDDDLDVHDVDIYKVTVCRLTATNTGRSDVAIKIANYWDLPLGTQVGKWKVTSGVFVDNNWTVDVKTSATAFEPASCPARATAPEVLTVELISARRGTIQWVAKVQESATSAILSDDSKLGNAVTVTID